MPTPLLSSALLLRVWDLPTRIFHWSLFVLVSTGLITGFISPEWWLDIHIGAGYGILLLLVFRLVWGIFGAEYSRFKTFIFLPKETIAHLRDLMFKRPRHYFGHNPAGALMIFALILVLSGITFSGLVALGGKENQGPLAGIVNYRAGELANSIHVTLNYCLLALIAGHIMGVIVEMRMTGENLVKSMIDGYKRIPKDTAVPAMRTSRPVAATGLLLAICLPAGAILWPLSTLAPSGMIQMLSNQEYQRECSDCHEIYHPSLLPETSWAMLMNGLEDHFGEDASLDGNVAVKITSHLLANSAEAWDTEASNRMSVVALDAPYQISASAYWLQRHGDIGESVFNRESIGGKSQCGSCHRDAAGGRFDDQMIIIPPQIQVPTSQVLRKGSYEVL